MLWAVRSPRVSHDWHDGSRDEGGTGNAPNPLRFHLRQFVTGRGGMHLLSSVNVRPIDRTSRFILLDPAAMQAVAEMLSPRISFTGFGEQEQPLRQSYLPVDAQLVDRIEEADIVTKSAVILELFWVAACVYEDAKRRGWAIESLSPEQLVELERYAKAMTRLDPPSVARDVEQHLGKPDLRDASVPQFSGVLRAVRSMLVACPIDAIEMASVRLAMEPWGHRCRVAYDGVQAFVNRCDDGASERVNLVGRQYAEGSLTIQEVAQLLELHVVDAVVELEIKGFARAPSVISLEDTERERILARLREDRCSRNGVYEATREGIARDVVASERIEGVDARRWITREGR